MFKKTLISEFFTTVSFNLALKSLSYLTYKLPTIRKWDNVSILEKKLLSYLDLQKSKIISLYNWRSAIFHALKIIDVKKNDEIIVNGYNCISVSNAVIQSWAKIIYSDISKENFWLDIKDLESKISKNTKAIIIQHTFWKIADIEKIKKLSKEKEIILIEDCAHSLWSKINNFHTWTFWDFAIFSTGRDKVISSVTWGFLVINNNRYFDKIKDIKKKLVLPSIKLTVKNLMYNLAWYKAYKLYDFLKLWRLIIFVSRKLNLITEILTLSERECKFKEFNFSLPNSLAWLAISELSKIEIFNNHRIMLANYYNNNKLNNKFITIPYKNEIWEKNNYFRFPILVKNTKLKEELYIYMRNNNVLLGNYWSWQPIIPLLVNQDKAKYIYWSCSVSENVTSRILTIPNHSLITIKNAEKIVKLLNNF